MTNEQYEKLRSALGGLIVMNCIFTFIVLVVVIGDGRETRWNFEEATQKIEAGCIGPSVLREQ